MFKCLEKIAADREAQRIEAMKVYAWLIRAAADADGELAENAHSGLDDAMKLLGFPIERAETDIAAMIEVRQLLRDGGSDARLQAMQTQLEPILSMFTADQPITGSVGVANPGEIFARVVDRGE